MKKSNLNEVQLLEEIEILKTKIDKLEKSITKQKRVERSLKMSRNQLKVLSRIIRHNLSNDFVVIRSAVNIYKKTSDLKMLNEIEKRVKKSLESITNYRIYESCIISDSDSTLEEIELIKLLNNIIIDFPSTKFNIQGNCKVIADDSLDLVFTNLIANSIKFGRSSQIDINISVEDEQCLVHYKDNSSGILEKNSSHICDKEFLENKVVQTGIGMHVIKKLIENYNGTIFSKTNELNNTEIEINLKTVIQK